MEARDGLPKLEQLFPRDGHRGDTTIDIIAVHGIETHSPKTWTAYERDEAPKGRAVNWLYDEDMLPKVVPQARIWVYDYNSNCYSDNAQEVDILDLGQTFLEILWIERSEDFGRRPLIFVGSCFGGIVIVQALERAYQERVKYADLLRHTIGVVFLGTPLRGTASVGPALSIAYLRGLFGKQTSTTLLKGLKEKDSHLHIVIHDFARWAISHKLQIRCFYETQPTNITKVAINNNWLTQILPTVKLVTKESACLDGHKRISLDVRHAMMNKFRGPRDGSFLLVSGCLEEFIKNPHMNQNRTTEEYNVNFKSSCSLSDPWTSMIPRQDLHMQKRNQELSETLIAKISAYKHEKVYRRFAEKHLYGTGKWFLEHADFQTWLNGQEPASLWLSGMVGCGKTMITTRVIKAVQDKSRTDGRPMAYFYCESAQRDMLRAQVLFESLIKQTLQYLAAVRKSYPKSVMTGIQDLYSYGGPEPDIEDVINLFSDLFNHLDTASYIIDGLDELSNEDIDHVSRTFCRLFQRPAKQKLFISSRSELHHNINLTQMIPTTKRVQVDLSLNSEDIRLFVETGIAEKSKHARPLTQDATLAQDLVRRLVAGAKEMFLWAELQIETLWDTCFTDKDIRFTLDNLPKDLHSTYRRCLERIERHNHAEHAQQVFKWIACASRPLRISEMQEALAFTLQDRSWEAGKTQDAKTIVARCANLVVLDAADQHVRFTHHSVQQYLTDPQDHSHRFHIDRDKGKLECGEFSINYLSFSDFRLQLQRVIDSSMAVPSGFLTPVINSTIQPHNTLGSWMRRTGNLFSKSPGPSPPGRIHLPTRGISPPAPDVSKYRFLRYAIQHWATDSKNIGRDSQMWQRFQSLAIQPNASWKLHPWPPGGQSKLSHLHGLLGWSVRNGHKPFLEALLDSISMDKLRELCDIPLVEDGLPALHAASRLGNIDILLLLLPVCGIRDQDCKGNTALYYAIEKGNVGAVKLLASSKEVSWHESKARSMKTPLLVASEKGHHEIVRELLNMGASIKATYGGLTALTLAAKHGHAEVVDVLIEAGMKDKSSNALHFAAAGGNSSVIALLLRRKISEVDAKNENEVTALHIAAGRGHENAVQVLLDRGADIQAKDDNIGPTALHLAALRGHEKAVQVLLDRGADIQAKDDNIGPTALHLAALRGHEKAVQVLLDRGADIQAKRGLGWTALHDAASRGHEKAVQVLLDRGADIQAKDGEGRTALHDAALKEHEKAVQVLLDRGADIEAKDGGFYTALDLAAEWKKKKDRRVQSI